VVFYFVKNWSIKWKTDQKPVCYSTVCDFLIKPVVGCYRTGPVLPKAMKTCWFSLVLLTVVFTAQQVGT
jgi:hypothetical protein